MNLVAASKRGLVRIHDMQCNIRIWQSRAKDGGKCQTLCLTGSQRIYMKESHTTMVKIQSETVPFMLQQLNFVEVSVGSGFEKIVLQRCEKNGAFSFWSTVRPPFVCHSEHTRCSKM